MREAFLQYYERELTYFRQMADEFSQQYPKVAKRLALEADKCEDPHVERLIESFAFLAARIHLKIDDEFPEITEALLQVLYPHYLSPIPSMTVVEFTLDPGQGKLTTGFALDAGTTLYSKRSEETVCRFRTSYPVTLWPIAVESARLDLNLEDAAGKAWPAAIRLRLRAHAGSSLRELEIDSLRFHISGGQKAQAIYEALFAFGGRVELRSPEGKKGSAAITLGERSLGEVGFAKDEGMLPYTSRSFLGYRLLQEYFALPEKFLFFDLLELEHLRSGRFDQAVDVLIFLKNQPSIESEIHVENFRLGCSPAVNLFEKIAEPIRLDHARTEYRVIADIRRQTSTEVYRVDRVVSMAVEASKKTEFQPFYSFKHSLSERGQNAFWHVERRQSERKDDPGTEVYLSLVDLDFQPTDPPADTLSVEITCSNRDLPARLPFGDEEGDFELSEAAPIKTIRCLIKPTPTLRPPLRNGAQWRLISHLSLNYLSLVDGGKDGQPEALREILSLYNYTSNPADARAASQLIEGVTGVRSRQVMRRIQSEAGGGFARGIEAILEFDETRYVGTGVFLFASVLEKFLGLYVSINSFSEMIAKTKQRGILKQWPPRSGQQILL